MSEAVQTDVEDLAARLAARGGAGRHLVAIAGAPGSGKSTFAERLAARLNRGEAGSAAILPMDGFHFDDAVLIARGLRARKGAPDTFDTAGLRHMLGRLKRNDEPEVAVPVFDRSLELSRAGARLIPQSVRHLLVEGNYLLLDQQPWTFLQPLYDVTVALVVPEETLRQRLVDRWRSFDLPTEEITAKVETNDLPNGRFVTAHSVQAQFTVNG